MNAEGSSNAGPSRHSPTVSKGQPGVGSLWAEILGGADRSKGLAKKNLIVLAERHHGRTHLLAQLDQNARKRRNDHAGVGAGSGSGRNGRKGLAIGYEVVDISDGDEDSVPPLSVFYPPSSHPSLLGLVPKALPPNSLSDTVVAIVLDWSKPFAMLRELVTWLAWVDQWAASSGQKGEVEEMRERLQSHLQHYTEPPTSNAGASAYAGVGPLLPLGQGTLTMNHAGVPIVVVCTRADLIDAAGEELGMKGGAWEEVTDWIQQVLRTICLSYGAAVFYTASSQPPTYTQLRAYLLHRLYTVPPPLNGTASEPHHTPSTRFPFTSRANVLDRDAVIVPAGWDSWGKINVLREGFDPARVGSAWEKTLERYKGADDAREGESLEEIWHRTVPGADRGAKATPAASISTVEPEQSFLSRQLEVLTKDPNRDPRQSFRHAAATVVGPMSGSDGLNLPGVEKAMAEMEGSEKGEELKEKFARLTRKESGRAGPLSPTGTVPAGTPTPAMPNEALHNFFQGLLANRSRSGTAATPTPAGAARPAEGA
ncbi:hypothetical protein IAU60_000064 [Kwoniella sp. DSM 27419]